jgi:type I restriction enzyme S subunit
MRPYLRAANVGWSGLRLDDVKHMNFTDAELDTYRLQPGDLLLSEASGSRGEVGKPALWSGEIEDCAFQNTLLRVRARKHEPEFLLHYFRYMALSGRFVPEARGVGINHLGRSRLAGWMTPMPERHEQRRIVEVLEDHLSHLDAGRAGLSNVQRHLDALVASQIDAALGSAGGQEVALVDVAESLKNGVFVSRPGTTAIGVPILRIGAVRPMVLSLDDLRYSALRSEELAAAGALLEEGDLLFTRYNGNPRFVGASAVVDGSMLPLTYPDKLIRMRLRRDRADPDFVCFATNYGPGRRQIEARLKTSAGQVGISGSELKRVLIRLPGVAEQGRAVGEIRFLLEARDRLAASEQAAASRAESLRRAVLAAAFEGKLTGRHTDDEVVEERAAAHTLKEVMES